MQFWPFVSSQVQTIQFSQYCYVTTLHTVPDKTEVLITWNEFFYSLLKYTGVLWYQRPCYNPFTPHHHPQIRGRQNPASELKTDNNSSVTNSLM
jgi:hypothetical protein